jgi:multiple sugar transport system ATP-binding protein
VSEGSGTGQPKLELPKLELRSVVKCFEGVVAVKGTSLALRSGEFLSLLGPSGCGKSTTLALIAGFLVPDEGEILVDGRSVTRVPPQKRRIGLVFQDYAIFTRLTVRRNLAFGLEAAHVPRAERNRMIAAIARQLDLEDLLERRGAQLNMSEMQRVALARVIITKPQLLLLDEPMSNLDAALRMSLRAELKQIQQELGQTVLYVTHDQVEAMSMSDRIAVMRAGELLQVAAPEEIYHRPANRFVAEFIGDPPINVVPCTVRRSGGQVRVSTACHQDLAMGALDIAPGEHWLAVRPYVFHASREPAPGAAATTVRFIENFGAEHVLHVDYGQELARVVVPPGFVGEGETIYLTLDPAHALLIDKASEAVVSRRRTEAAA